VILSFHGILMVAMACGGSTDDAGSDTERQSGADDVQSDAPQASAAATESNPGPSPGREPEPTPANAPPSAGALDTGIDERTALSDLDASELDQLCTAITEYTSSPEVAHYVCTVGSALGASLGSQTEQEFRAACGSAVAECIGSDVALEANCAEFPLSCQATVGDYEVCAEQTFSADPPVHCGMTLAQVQGVLERAETGFLGDLPECQRLDACTATSGSTAATSAQQSPMPVLPVMLRR
jgi:hypothetical protein